MYKQVETAQTAMLDNGAHVTPVATLHDEYGGISHFVVDDGCYALVNGSSDRPFKFSAWIYHEAFEVLKTLPPLRS